MIKSVSVTKNIMLNIIDIVSNIFVFILLLLILW